MFSKDEKIKIAEAIEKLLLELNHPEMQKEKPRFTLYVSGKSEMSYAEIKPNWTYENKEPGVNPFNEVSRELHGGR